MTDFLSIFFLVKAALRTENLGGIFASIDFGLDYVLVFS